MEYNLSDLKKKSVINTVDGKDIGKITDVLLSYPEGVWSSFIVGKKCRIFNRERYVIKLCCIDKIGEDTILVHLGGDIPPV